MSESRATIGVFGGSGLYELFEDVEEVKIDTPYGETSDLISLATVKGKRVAFLPRHGHKHHIPPHMIPYRANVYAMKSLGVHRIIGPAAVGSLQERITPGDFVVCDQFVDRTWGRKDTFYDGPIVTHIEGAHPYCESLRSITIEACREQGINVHTRGTVVVIQGPRFSTCSESDWFTRMGWEVVSMTAYPEVILARELGICYVNISLVTDHDAGLVAGHGGKPVNVEEVMRVLSENATGVRGVIMSMIDRMPEEPCPECMAVMEKARM
jgi:5'-methylthioadenosine phosphorylase